MEKVSTEVSAPLLTFLSFEALSKLYNNSEEYKKILDSDQSLKYLLKKYGRRFTSFSGFQHWYIRHYPSAKCASAYASSECLKWGIKTGYWPLINKHLEYTGNHNEIYILAANVGNLIVMSAMRGAGATSHREALIAAAAGGHIEAMTEIERGILKHCGNSCTIPHTAILLAAISYQRVNTVQWLVDRSIAIDKEKISSALNMCLSDEIVSIVSSMGVPVSNMAKRSWKEKITIDNSFNATDEQKKYLWGTIRGNMPTLISSVNYLNLLVKYDRHSIGELGDNILNSIGWEISTEDAIKIMEYKMAHGDAYSKHTILALAASLGDMETLEKYGENPIKDIQLIKYVKDLDLIKETSWEIYNYHNYITDTLSLAHPPLDIYDYMLKMGNSEELNIMLISHMNNKTNDPPSYASLRWMINNHLAEKEALNMLKRYPDYMIDDM